MFELLKRIDRKRRRDLAVFTRLPQGKTAACFPKNCRHRYSPDRPFLPSSRSVVGEAGHVKSDVACFPGRHRLKKQIVLGVDVQWRIKPRVVTLLLFGKNEYDLLYMNNQPASNNIEGYLAGEMAGLPVVQHCRIEPTLHTSEAAVVNRVCQTHHLRLTRRRRWLAAQRVAENRLRVVHNAIDSRPPCRNQLHYPLQPAIW